ncbi:glutamate 5-kinase [Aequitasia blattaphilus]|uniref:Glutamate 5-kinase n=1 Tax=Aequitasia blattaphilus TaxID=2949332 RepID=A0ABT1E8W5_9FIRM|nr:glutamate 5-kinase [Aequitasia blattaphilus]MCP1102275.1 glutamate 5-kinase [Aequitasia blattaphilus]MCR8614915.1 glutamate 5-kinase [Aequitasia blattaphilus]
MDVRESLKDKKKIVIKVGTSTITHKETGNIDLDKLEKFVRILTNLINKGKEVIVVSSGAIGIGRNILGLKERPKDKAIRQACAAVGQGKLIMMYEKLFAEYGYLTAQVLLTKESISNGVCAKNARSTFEQLSKMKVIPIVNENDAISVDEEGYGNFGDNDTMAADVASLVNADLLILMSDINGLYTDDPKENPNARFVHTVSRIDSELERMGRGSGTSLGTGGMATKIKAAKIATNANADMVIANGESIYMINDIMAGKKVGTIFLSKKHPYKGENELAPIKDIYRKHRNKIMKNTKGELNDELYASNW